jgi:hypothetical protein
MATPYEPLGYDAWPVALIHALRDRNLILICSINMRGNIFINLSL